MFMIDYKEYAWWYWFFSAVFLSIGVAGYPEAYLFAIGLTIIQLIQFIIMHQSFTHFSVQVRFCYLLILLAALPEPMQWVYWLPVMGTWAQLIFGYCPLARIVSLFSWNCEEKLSIGLIKNTFFSRPVRGNILQGLPSIESDTNLAVEES